MTPEEIINEMGPLLSLPESVVRINELLDSPQSSAKDFGEIISHDPALAVRLLKLVNSALYGFPAQIDTISRAITLIGTEELRSLVMTTSATQVFHGIASDMIDMNVFWHRSVYCGLVAKKLALFNHSAAGEAMFLVGLLHNIGSLVLFSRLPDQAQHILTEAERSGRSVYEIEKQKLAFDSAELGATLLKHWHLPKKLWEPVRFQHQPDVSSEYFHEAQLLSLALKITNCVEPELKTEHVADLGTLKGAELNGQELGEETLELITIAANAESFEVLSIINPDAMLIY